MKQLKVWSYPSFCGARAITDTIGLYDYTFPSTIIKDIIRKYACAFLIKEEECINWIKSTGNSYDLYDIAGVYISFPKDRSYTDWHTGRKLRGLLNSSVYSPNLGSKGKFNNRPNIFRGYDKIRAITDWYYDDRGYPLFSLQEDIPYLLINSTWHRTKSGSGSIDVASGRDLACFLSGEKELCEGDIGKWYPTSLGYYGAVLKLFRNPAMKNQQAIALAFAKEPVELNHRVIK